jgi:Ca2+/Na+ antiporter
VRSLASTLRDDSEWLGTLLLDKFGLKPDTSRPMLLVVFANSQLVGLFACAGLVLYLAARAAVDALTSPADPLPGRMAAAHWMPIAWAAVLATLAGHSDVGIAILLASSVAAMALVLGVLLCVSNEGDTGELPRAATWPFVVPAALLVLLAGFSGSLSWWHGLMLLALGACIAAVWTRKRGPNDPLPFAWIPGGSRALSSGPGFEVSSVSAPDTAQNVSTQSNPSHLELESPQEKPNRHWATQLMLAIALGGVGAWMGYRGIMLADDRTRMASSGLVSLAVLSPLLVLSLLGTGAIAAHNRRMGAVQATIVGVVLLNLCLLLPLVILCHYIRQLILAWLGGAHTLDALGAGLSAAPFPIGAWRIDTMLLIVLGLMLVPVSLGRWKLGKLEGLGLVFIYAAYLIASTAIAIRA